MAKYFFGALLVFACSAIWLTFEITAGNATYSWVATPATIQRPESNGGFGKRRTSIRTPVTYTFAGKDYDGIVGELLVPGKGTVYVNPDDPTQVVGIQGPGLQNFGRPLIFTIASGLVIVVLGLIAFSPKED